MDTQVVQIQMQNDRTLYKPGELISGQVHIDLEKLSSIKKVKGIMLRFIGRASVHWLERYGSNVGPHVSPTTTMQYTNSQSYFEHELLLWQSGSRRRRSGADIQPAIVSSYPFQFLLPVKLPSSFEGEFGNVRYWIECEITRKRTQSLNCLQHFRVMTKYDLNKVPHTRDPHEVEEMEILCFFFCTSRSITARVTVDRTGYVPGETIAVTCMVDNESRRKVERCAVKLQKVITYKSKPPNARSRPVSSTIVHYTHAGVRAGDTAQWRQDILVPPLMPSDLIHCDIIDVNYYIVLTAVPARLTSPFEAKLSVTIGTEPLADTYDTAPPPYTEAISTVSISHEPDTNEIPAPPPYTETNCIVSKMPHGTDRGDLSVTSPPPAYTQENNTVTILPRNQHS